jgi:hypothetical protein
LKRFLIHRASVVLAVVAGKRLRREFGGVREAMNFNELLDIDVRVNLGGVEPGVSKHLLDVTQVGAVLQHERGHRVPEQVATAIFGDAAGFHVVVNHMTQDTRRQAASCLSARA